MISNCKLLFLLWEEILPKVEEDEANAEKEREQNGCRVIRLRTSLEFLDPAMPEASVT